MNLTRQEQLVIITIVSLLLLGWAVKAWRTAHPSGVPVPTVQQS